MAKKSNSAAAAAASAAATASAPLQGIEGLCTTKKVFGMFPVPGFILSLAAMAIQGLCLLWALWRAYDIRLYAINEYGPVIHEFDPWFNFRATQYLSKNGWHAFFHWFDHMSWYPLGRPVGTTIYPGLQITSVAMHRVLRWLGKPYRMTLNDICCYTPAWFGSIATVFIVLITYEATRSRTAAVIAAMVFAIIPAHIMRSMGGGYDNECIAMTAMLMTFYFWIRSLRNSSSWWIGVIAGLAYGYMVAAWGGFTFVLNMVALHAFTCLFIDFIRGRWDPTLHKAYTLFFIIGTSLATRVPPVNSTPFKSLEQLSAVFVFVIVQLLWFTARMRASQGVDRIWSYKGLAISLRVLLCGAVLSAAVFLLLPSGWFGPLSSRVRGLFLKHTRTGNPLVDSVAEHQPANANAYNQNMHHAVYGWAGAAIILPFLSRRPRAALFIFIYSVVAYYLCQKMARLLLLASPVAAGGSGICLGLLIDYCFGQFLFDPRDDEPIPAPDAVPEPADAAAPTKGNKSQPSKAPVPAAATYLDGAEAMRRMKNAYRRARFFRQFVVTVIIASLAATAPAYWKEFVDHSEELAHAFSNPRLMFKSRLQNGQVIMVDDYREAYHWLRDKTPADARVMAWWDYGYQITGIGNRTTIADGNTWNHEHIATLGKCLTSPVKEAHSLIRHLADYVLVWAGGGGDDLGKSPHMARIGNSVYRDICPADPLCSHFGFYDNGFDKPTPSMKRSLLFHLHSSGTPGSKVKLNTTLFKRAYQTKFGLVRIFKVMNVSQESKAWLADPANRLCDEGGWYCPGQYPPVPEFKRLLAKRRDFGQLEDFNRKKVDDKYNAEYMKRFK